MKSSLNNKMRERLPVSVQVRARGAFRLSSTSWGLHGLFVWNTKKEIKFLLDTTHVSIYKWTQHVRLGSGCFRKSSEFLRVQKKQKAETQKVPSPAE